MQPPGTGLRAGRGHLAQFRDGLDAVSGSGSGWAGRAGSSPPPPVQGWGCTLNPVNREMVPSLLPSLSLVHGPVLYVPYRVLCHRREPDRYWLSADFPARFACCPAGPACLSVYFTSECRTARRQLCQAAATGTWAPDTEGGRTAGWLRSWGSACCGPGHPDRGCRLLEPADGFLALGACTGRSRWIVKSRSVSASGLPVTPPTSAPVVLRLEPTLGFPKGRSFSC